MASRFTRPITTPLRRRYATSAPPPPPPAGAGQPLPGTAGQPLPNSGGGGGGIPILPTLALLSLVGGGYYYYSNTAALGPTYGQQASQHATNASRSASDAGHALIEGKGRQAVDDASNAVRQVAYSADARIDQAKSNLSSDKSKAESQSKTWWNDAKKDTKSTAQNVQDGAHSALDKLASKGDELKGALKQKKSEVDSEARGWFSWGKSQAKEGESSVRDNAIWAQRETAKKVQAAGDKVSDKAGEYK